MPSDEGIVAVPVGCVQVSHWEDVVGSGLDELPPPSPPLPAL